MHLPESLSITQRLASPRPPPPPPTAEESLELEESSDESDELEESSDPAAAQNLDMVFISVCLDKSVCCLLLVFAKPNSYQSVREVVVNFLLRAVGRTTDTRTSPLSPHFSRGGYCTDPTKNTPIS